jgi:hypothetical protein
VHNPDTNTVTIPIKSRFIVAPPSIEVFAE